MDKVTESPTLVKMEYPRNALHCNSMMHSVPTQCLKKKMKIADSQKILACATSLASHLPVAE